MPLSESFEQYGKAKAPTRNKNKKEEAAPKDEQVKDKKREQKPQGFFELFSGERVTVTLINGEKLTGTLKTDFYNRYDVLLDSALLPKHGILYIQKTAGGGAE